VSVGRFESPEDFVVEELPAYLPQGEGDHTFLWIEKRLRNTDDVARELARAAGVSPRDVGYAGRKDRFAVARQHFSVPGLPVASALGLRLEGARVLGATPHRHKLRTGHLAGNRFDLRLRGIDPDPAARAAEVCQGLAALGLPNRFGAQRFGRGGGNTERGRQLLQGEPVKSDRREARFLISALQAAVFNEALQLRCLRLDEVEEGDLARRTDSGGLFRVEDVPAENLRAQRFEISATGPIFGTRMERPTGAVAVRERQAMAAFGLDPEDLRAPKGVRMRGARRPLRVSVGDLSLGYEDGVLRLRFELPAGSFATVLLEELLAEPRRVSSAP
jgi:tRNA pseudouridine13 synthase